MSSAALDDLQHDLTDILQQTIQHPSLHPQNLSIIPNKKSWLLNLDAVVLADAGNVVDALFMASRAALWDTKVPRTRSIEYRAPDASKASKKDVHSTAMDVDDSVSGFDTRDMARTAADFELPDYWDEGEVLDGQRFFFATSFRPSSFCASIFGSFAPPRSRLISACAAR